MIAKRLVLLLLLPAMAALLPSCAHKPPVTPPPVKAPDPEPSIPVASQAADHPGFVISPYTGRLVDISDCPPGTFARDPTTATVPEEMKIFRVPGVTPGQ